MNVWQRMTERGRRVVYFAQEEAKQLGEDYVSTEHLLLGLIREDDCLAVLLLEQMELPALHVRAEIEKHLTRATGNTQTEMHLTDRAKRVIQIAYEEAQGMGNNHIGTEHLLLALIRDESGIAGRVLAKLGADMETARHVVRVAQETPSPHEDNLSKRPITRTRVQETVGYIGVLAAEGRTMLEVAINNEALTEMITVFRAQDVLGYRKMVETGRMLLISAGTEVKRLAYERSPGVRVRLRSGEHLGKAVWVFEKYFQPIRPDEEPFPPATTLKIQEENA
jgi:hypothetical protein